MGVEPIRSLGEALVDVPFDGSQGVAKWWWRRR
jgi:hypothetical protein